MTKVVLKTVKFSDMFSYGPKNELSLNKNRITQLDAPNGSGKTTIAYIIQELLFSKNVKGIKKTDIINRYSKSKNWEGSLTFSVDDKEYEISVKRVGAASKVQLLENGKDVSEHKVPDTYKKLADLLGSDFTVFSQLTYQSASNLLDFLNATDTNRKKFLINLFNLEKYLTIGEKVKTALASVEKENSALAVELKTITSFLDSTTIPKKQEEKLVPIRDDSLAVRLAEVKKELENINATCKTIDKNNMLIRDRDSLVFSYSVEDPGDFLDTELLNNYTFEINRLAKEISAKTKEANTISLNDKCPACGQSIDNSHLIKIKQDLSTALEIDQAAYEGAKEEKAKLTKVQKDWKAKKDAFDLNQLSITRFEQLTQLIDESIPTSYPDFNALTKEKQELEYKIAEQNQLVNDVTNFNKQVSAHNAKVDALIEQKAEFLIRQEALNSSIMSVQNRLNKLTILKKAFSPTGIVAFKLENLTKELENSINRYLSMMSDGQFQVEFVLDKEKLNIAVINNGIASPIETVSAGEFSRIQTSVLLAIRSLLSVLGGSSINLLFLDEITGVLDEEGKEKLIETLQKEENLNVFLISHEFSHPLIDKIQIIKENNISSIQN